MPALVSKETDGLLSSAPAAFTIGTQGAFRTGAFLFLLLFLHFVVHRIILLRSKTDTKSATSNPCKMILTFCKTLRTPEVTTASLICNNIFY